MRPIFKKINIIVSVITSKNYLVFFLLFFISGISSFNPTGSFSSRTVGENYNSGFFYTAEELEFLDQQITKVLTDNGFNGTILISRHGMIIYEKAMGFTGHTREEPLNMETGFQIASISKTFTAAAVLILQQKGLLDIDDKVNLHIPEFPYKNITIKHLLSHTSGLQNYMWLLERRWTRSGYPTNEDVLKLFIENRRPLNFTPGQRFDYSNTGYVFLGLLIERVSGKSFSEFIHQNIFEPLDMTRSFVHNIHKGTSIKNRAYGFRKVRGRSSIITDDKLDGPLGDKGIFSSAGDLFKWDQAIYSGQILSPEIWQRAFTPGRLNNDSVTNYGLGWRLQTYLDKKIVYHTGRWRGFRTIFKRIVDDNTTLIVLSNNDLNIITIIEKIRDIIYHDEREIWLANNSPEASVEEKNPEPDEPNPLSQ